MAGKRREKITEREITGLKYFDKLAPLLARLHDDGCARDKAGNRELHFDQYCLLILLYLFNPVVTSLRGLQPASELAKVRKKLGCSRASLGSFSEVATVFDPERLKAIIAELGVAPRKCWPTLPSSRPATRRRKKSEAERSAEQRLDARGGYAARKSLRYAPQLPRDRQSGARLPANFASPRRLNSRAEQYCACRPLRGRLC